MCLLLLFFVFCFVFVSVTLPYLWLPRRLAQMISVVISFGVLAKRHRWNNGASFSFSIKKWFKIYLFYYKHESV